MQAGADAAGAASLCLQQAEFVTTSLKVTCVALAAKVVPASHLLCCAFKSLGCTGLYWAVLGCTWLC